MSKIVWDKSGERLYETGVDQGVLYPQDVSGTYPLGVPWNGLTAVTESPSGAESNPIYADNTKYLNLLSLEEFGATVEAYTYPDEFAECDGSAEISPGIIIGQQARKTFGLCYRTALGNDTEGSSHGYKLHMVYGGSATPSEKGYTTINDSPEAITFSWELTTTPVNVTGFKPTASLVLDSTKVASDKLTQLETILYGAEGVDPRLPLPDEIVSIFGSALPDALALSSIVPDDEATAVSKSANIVLTFNNKILRESIIITTAAGVIVACVKTWDTAGKVLTINPSADLSGTTVYIVTIGGVMDIYGQTLAAAVKNFTTAA